MIRFIFLILLTACSLNLPAQLPADIKSPVNINKNGKVLAVYIESEGDAYSIVGIHPLSGREFLIQVKSGQIIKEEYGYLFSASEVREILEEVIK